MAWRRERNNDRRLDSSPIITVGIEPRAFTMGLNVGCKEMRAN